MAQNDMHIVICRILSYIYSCMKKGEEPVLENYDSNACGIPEPYWVQVMAELVSHGYVSGVSVKKVTTGDVVNCSKPRVTLDGVQFLMEKSMMNKAARALFELGGKAAELVLPFLS